LFHGISVSTLLCFKKNVYSINGLTVKIQKTEIHKVLLAESKLENQLRSMSNKHVVGKYLSNSQTGGGQTFHVLKYPICNENTWCKRNKTEVMSNFSVILTAIFFGYFRNWRKKIFDFKIKSIMHINCKLFWHYISALFFFKAFYPENRRENRSENCRKNRSYERPLASVKEQNFNDFNQYSRLYYFHSKISVYVIDRFLQVYHVLVVWW